MLFWMSYMQVFYTFVFVLVQHNWAHFTRKGALEIQSLLLASSSQWNNSSRKSGEQFLDLLIQGQHFTTGSLKWCQESNHQQYKSVNIDTLPQSWVAGVELQLSWVEQQLATVYFQQHPSSRFVLQHINQNLSQECWHYNDSLHQSFFFVFSQITPSLEVLYLELRDISAMWSQKSCHGFLRDTQGATYAYTWPEACQSMCFYSPWFMLYSVP